MCVVHRRIIAHHAKNCNIICDVVDENLISGPCLTQGRLEAKIGPSDSFKKMEMRL